MGTNMGVESVLRACVRVGRLVLAWFSLVPYRQCVFVCPSTRKELCDKRSPARV